MSLPFIKISATGNDFILIDNRDGKLDARRDGRFFSRICRRRRSVGADGVILLQKSGRADFHYVHINADGSIAEMCGNGSRAVFYFASQLGIVSQAGCFEINGNIYRAALNGKNVTTEFIPPGEYTLQVPIAAESGYESGGYIDTGVPHFVLFVAAVDAADVAGLGAKYRRHPFFPRGTNVDFVQIAGSNGGAHLHSGSSDRPHPKNGAHLFVRTYERGVEQETLACGTGAVAAAIISHLRYGTQSPARISFPGGELIVTFDADFKKITLTGDVTPVYQGILIDSDQDQQNIS